MNVTSIYPNVNQIGLPSAVGGTTATTVADANRDVSAQTGDISSIRPHHHGHHHHHATAGYAQAQDGTSPSQGATGVPGVTTPTTDVRTQVDDIIGQVLTQGLGNVAGVTT
ncbi:MAG TPA: hypothetical protein VKU61_07840 [Candidatus Binatia bacterium]|nr:hypothetical protein [Candidatus Binatia bacterium]